VVQYTTMAGAMAAIEGMRHVSELVVYDLQSLQRSLIDDATPSAAAPGQESLPESA
jgi:hypothetical protein